LLVGGHSPNPPEPRFHSGLRINKVDADRTSHNIKKRETPLCHYNEISLNPIESVQLSFAFRPALSTAQI